MSRAKRGRFADAFAKAIALQMATMDPRSIVACTFVPEAVGLDRGPVHADRSKQPLTAVGIRGSVSWDRTAVVAPNLVKQGFRAQGPNRLWVAEITCIPTRSRFLYVVVVLDAWSRRVVG
jgi:hypothetical protein